VGFGLFALHWVSLFLPKIPPIHKRYSVTSYLLAHLSVVLLLVGLKRMAPALVEWWRASRVGTIRWRIVAGAVVGGCLAGALAVRRLAPDLFARYSREEGLLEPVTLLCYAGSAIVLWTASQGLDRNVRRPWRTTAGLFIVLALEEMDYFGVFGGMIGRIRGEYVGSLHDLVRLTSEGIVTGAGVWLMAAIAVVVMATLWWVGALSAGWVGRRIASSEFGWVVAGAMLLWIAAAEEAHFFGWVAAPPYPEEAVELAGALCLAVWSVESVARRVPTTPGERGARPSLSPDTPPEDARARG
jgi:hypothetical protein